MDYYKAAKVASLNIGAHPGLLFLQKKCRLSSKVLDVGCGEGSRLETLMSGKKGWGIDINAAVIKLAKSQYPEHNFRVANATMLPFKDAFFDLVYSAFTIEHCQNPEKFILEMFRVCKTGGTVAILTPNFGAPNRRSPVSTENPFTKFLRGLMADYIFSSSLGWKLVQPKSVYDRPDDDTTVEPYLHSLVRFIAAHKYKIEVQTSLWELEPNSFNPRKLVFKILGKMKLYPFRYWGPQIFVAAVK